jgi:hypothetical protein
MLLLKFIHKIGASINLLLNSIQIDELLSAVLKLIRIGAGAGAILGTAFAQSQTGHSEGADIDFGGLGTDPGKFTIIQDITFDPKGNLYTLEAGGTKHGEFGSSSGIPPTFYTGVARVQKFDGNGNFLSQFPLGDDRPLDIPSRPERIAADADGNVFVTFPKDGLVLQFGPDGRKEADRAVPNAEGVAIDSVNGEERVAVIARGATQEILLINPKDGKQETLALSVSLSSPGDLSIDKNGHFYVLTDQDHGISVFDAQGKQIRAIGGGPKETRNDDGSEPLYRAKVDSKGNIYTDTWDNPNWLTQYSADGKFIRQHQGQFQWGDDWGYFWSLPMAISPDDRLWVASPVLLDPKGPHYSGTHFRPAIVRADANFFDPKTKAVREHSMLAMGLATSLQTKLPFNVTETLDPISVDFVVGSANRNLTELTADYHVYDTAKNELGKGTLQVPLQNGD